MTTDMTMEHTTEKPLIEDDIYFNCEYVKDQLWDMEVDGWVSWWISPLFTGYDKYVNDWMNVVDDFNERNNESWIDCERHYYECRDDMIEKCRYTFTKLKHEGDSDEEEEEEEVVEKPNRFTRMNVGDTFEVQENLLYNAMDKAQFIRLCEIFVEEFNENNTETQIEMEHTEKDNIVSVRYIKVLKK